MRYFALLKDAIRLFYERDAAKLLRGEDNKSACERCIVNCIARYLWCLIQQRGLKVDVDVEYNLDLEQKDFKRVQLALCRTCSRSNCLMHKFATGELRCRESREVLRRQTLVYPDLIAHVRGPGRNYLAVEFKKEKSAFIDGEYTNDALWDMAKLRYFGCKERRDGFVRYDNVVFVILKSDKPQYVPAEKFFAIRGHREQHTT